jgi:hypothetical protein
MSLIGVLPKCQWIGLGASEQIKVSLEHPSSSRISMRAPAMGVDKLSLKSQVE